MFPLCSPLWQLQTYPLAGSEPPSLSSPLRELTGFCLAVNCLAPGCRGERAFAIGDLAKFYGRDRTVADVLQRMRCSGDCGGRVVAAWLTTGPILNALAQPILLSHRRRAPGLGIKPQV
jgi:hypothetical protein